MGWIPYLGGASMVLRPTMTRGSRRRSCREDLRLPGQGGQWRQEYLLMRGACSAMEPSGGQAKDGCDAGGVEGTLTSHGPEYIGQLSLASRVTRQYHSCGRISALECYIEGGQLSSECGHARGLASTTMVLAGSRVPWLLSDTERTR